VRAALVAAVGALGALVAAPVAHAAPVERFFALVVGYNGRPPASDEAVQTLRYADDDALAFYRLEKEAGADAVVLTLPDAETRRRYPQASEVARPPTMDEIKLAIAALNQRMDEAARRGEVPVLLFFYSGHGARHQGDEAALTLLDGMLPQSSLYQDVLDQVHAQVINLVIDACHSEAVVRPRDLEARTATVTDAELLAHLGAVTSARYPRVGLVIANGGSVPVQEWDVYQSGIFTHEVLSGLRGAADVNHDGRIEYSELGAFLNAANREVQDPRARIQSIVQPPATRPHTPLIQLAPRSTAWLTDISASVGRFFVEDLHGNRIIDGRAEAGFSMSVAVPPDQPLFVRTGDHEADVVVPSGVQRRFDELAFRVRQTRARGALETSLEAGLFLMPYGPGYYGGYIDRLDAVPVAGLSAAPLVDRPKAAARPSGKTVATWSLAGASAALATSSAIFAGLAWSDRRDFEGTTMQIDAQAASDRYHRDTTLALTFLIPALVCGAAAYLVGRRP
jgi:hypothetical protein